MVQRIKIRPHEIGLHFYNGEFKGLKNAGTHWLINPLSKHKIDVVSMRDLVLKHERLNEIVKSGVLKGLAVELELSDYQRALVWLDGRFFDILAPGVHVMWKKEFDVNVQIIDAREVQFEHSDMQVITRKTGADKFLNVCDVSRDHAGVYHRDGRFQSVLEPGRYAFWKGMASTRVVEVDLRERTIDVVGQDLMTADNVTLRLNAVVTWKVVDPRLVVKTTQDVQQSLYRESQLVLREMVGSRELDELLSSKQTVASDTQQQLASRAAALGVGEVTVGIRDVILPGDMKTLLNQVTQAKKAAEANLISRREETAAIRSQANTAKLLDANPTLMRLRELEVLEKVASSSNLKVSLGNGESLKDRLTKLI